MTAEAPSFVADVAAQVVAWHNRHPLARRITRKDVQGIGTVVLPYAREGQPPWDAPQPKRSLLALMFPPRRNRRLWPLFSEDLVPEIGLKRLVRFGARHGLDRRPGPSDLPERVAITEPDRLERPGAAYPPERVNRFLVSAAIDIGPNRPRLMLGGGKRPPVLGQRLWSLPRLAALGGSLLLAMVIGVAGLWLKAMAPRPAAAGAPVQAASGPTAGSAAARVVAPGPAQASASMAPPSAPVSASPPAASAPAAAAPASAPRLVTPTASASAVPPAPAPAALPAPIGGNTASAAVPAPPASATAPAPVAPVAAPQASAAAAATVPVQQASAPLVPRLKPDLAASARAEADGRALRPAAAAASAAAGTPPGARPALPPTGAAPGLRPAAPAAAASSARFYALVTRPTRSKAEAEALLRRLRAETDRIGHPTASQTGLLESAEGWRVTWWPFTHQRQADNARNALARRFELEVVEF